jgi:outer membrane protein OmpA-like peptidoglycan-associated protein
MEQFRIRRCRPADGPATPSFRSLVLATALCGLLGAPASAQMYPGQDVIVNPAGMPQPSLLNPGEPYPGTLLRPPHRHHRHVAKAAAVATAAPATATQAAPTQPAPAQPAAAPAPPPRGKAATPTQSGALPFTFGEGDAEAVPPPEPAPYARPGEPVPGPAPAPGGADEGLVKHGAILFEHASTSPQPAQMHGIKMLASDLGSVIEAGATRVQLQGFGGERGDKSSDARRIALKRALAIRQLLIDNGVPANRIDVRAMGGVTDGGEPDRVDIYVRAG